MSESWKKSILNKTTVIDNVRQSLRVVEEMMNPKQSPPDGKIVVFFDCEGVNLGPGGYATILQIATMNGKAYIFDIQKTPNLFQDGGLKMLLENKSIVKVIHDCRCDSYNLYSQFGISLSNIFDTRAAFAIIQSQNTGQPVYEMMNVGFDKLRFLYGSRNYVPKKQMKIIYRINPNYWSQRPLSEDKIANASSDVLSLAQIYTTMSRLMKPEMSKVFEDLCYEQVNTHLKQTEVEKRKNQRKLDNQVADLQKKRKNE